MGNVRIQTTLVGAGQGSGLANDVDTLTEALMSLVNTYIPGLPALKGIRSFAVEENDRAPIPCCMIQPAKVTPAMVTTARFEKWYQFDLWFAVGGNTVEDVAVLSTDAGALFQKLFSNNALNDRNGPTPSNKYATNGTLWVFSKMDTIDFSPALLSGRDPGPKYFGLGNFQLRLQTVPALM